MIPRLLRFYGGDVGGWLAVPVRWLRACNEQLPIIQAEEQLAHVAALTAADSNIEARKRQPLLDEWRRTAQAGQPRRVKRAKLSPAEFAAMLNTIGVAHG